MGVLKKAIPQSAPAGAPCLSNLNVQTLIDLVPSPSNALELCVGTLAEMTEGDIYEDVDPYSRQGKTASLHLRNVVGKAPHYLRPSSTRATWT